MSDEFFSRRSVNLDSTHRCPLMCPNCARQTYYNDRGQKVPGWDITLENFTKVAEFFDTINFEGQYSDPAHHPKFIDMLKIAYDNAKTVYVQHAANKKKNVDWYRRAWDAHPYARWRFSIDGLPKDSHKYRINQDGKFLFKMMIKSKFHLHNKPMWQYIVFKYNQDDIDEAVELAAKHDIEFYLIHSGRWKSIDDPLMPRKEFRMRTQ
jgi:MoaA/NifB/PqqE/SkfB family radical SAM enzyme